MSKLAETLNPYLSDLVIFYLKLHDLHWNVKGRQFVPVHQYTEARYDDMAAKFDEIAEIMIMNGEKPVSAVSQYLKLASIKELGKELYRDDEVIKILLEDMTALKKEATAIRADMDAAGAFDVVAILEAHIAGYAKEIWFLEAMLA